MSYLEDLQLLIEKRQLSSFLRLWEEYCQTEEVEKEELLNILSFIKESSLANAFGQFSESTLSLWEKMEDSEHKDRVLQIILDLQTTNSPLLKNLAIDFLTKKYAHQEHFNEKLRIIGLKGRKNFQRAISNYLLLSHLGKKKFVFHTGGWGVGEVLEISLLREHILIEFEGISALKDLSFENAFRNLIPLADDHFLSRRFGDPDTLEAEGKKDPAFLIRLLLRDLGSKTSKEIKEELCGLVIREEDWQKWWQIARTKIKKDTKIQFPQTAKEAFQLRKKEISHSELFQKALKEAKTAEALIEVTYNFTRDFPEVIKDTETQECVKKRIMETLQSPELSQEEQLGKKISLYFLLESIFPKEFSHASEEMISSLEDPMLAFRDIAIISFKKRFLLVIREKNPNWESIFFHALFLPIQNSLRDYVFKELHQNPKTQELLKEKIKDLLHKVTLYPEAFFWYFQKVCSGEKEIPSNDKESKYLFLEACLILLHSIEENPEYRDLAKRIHSFLTGKRYAVIRDLIQGASIEYLMEFLLLASKCHCLAKNDMRILHSLAEVVKPSLKKKKETQEVIWTTPEGMQKIKERIYQVGNVEIVDCAREIEAARALGDLRENSEYKFALERRAWLQNELKRLTHQLNKAKVVTKADITVQEVGVGGVVDVLDSQNKKITYTVLGPWEADPDKNILSFQSQFAQAMIGHKKGETFTFSGKKYIVESIKSYLS